MTFGSKAAVTLGIWPLWAYILLTVFTNTPKIGFFNDIEPWGLLASISIPVIYTAVEIASRQNFFTQDRLKKAAIISAISLVSVLLIDTVYGISNNVKAGHNPWTGEASADDSNIWAIEMTPRFFYPTGKNFEIAKPNVTLSGFSFGQEYFPKWLESPTLKDSVMEGKYYSYVIDEHGFRNASPLSDSRIFAVGDSFGFGFGVNQEKVWTSKLGSITGEPIYNLSYPGSTPAQQLWTVEYLIDEFGDDIQIDQLLWLIFEGNDLEDTPSPNRKVAQSSITPREIFNNSIVGSLVPAVRQMQGNSVIHQLLTGSLKIGQGGLASGGTYSVDGVKLPSPLYFSEEFGFRIFSAPFIDRARKSKEYVLNHPNRPALDRIFEQMAVLSTEHGFSVTVMVAPTPERMYAQKFKDFPTISEEPHFINYVHDQAAASGFDVLDLRVAMMDYAEDELLYWRDDGHWNERGNEVVAQIIADSGVVK